MGNDETPSQTPNRGLSDPVKVALIGATATIVVALISGLFALARREPAALPPTETPTFVATAQPPATATAMNAPLAAAVAVTPMATPSPPESGSSRQPVSETGFTFASRISPDGVALDPGMTLPPTVKEVYAVFQVGRTPPGVNISHPNPTDGTYYAFLERADEASPAKIGWQWFLKGDLINEYETSLHSGYLWLSLYAQGERGLFEDSFGPPATYDVRITLNGNPALRAQLVISPTVESTDQ